MARKLTGFTIQRTRKSAYPWEQWTDGEVWEVRRNEDFTCTVPSMLAALWTRAKKMEMKAEVASQGDVVQFRFVRKP